MGQLWLPEYEVCTKQPQTMPVVNRDNPLSKDLLMYYVPGAMAAPFGATTHLTGPGPTAVSVSKGGLSRSEKDMGSTFRMGVKFASNSITIVAVIRRNTLYNSDSSGNNIVELCLDGWGSYKIGLAYPGYANRSKLGFTSALPYQTNTSCSYDFSAVTHPDPVVVIGRRWFNVDTSLWMDGEQVATGGPNGSTLSPLNGADAYLVNGQLRGAFDNGQNGVSYGWMIFNRALSDEEIRNISDNPWQLFRQKVSTPLDVTTKENRKPILRESTLLGTSKRKLSDTNVISVPTGDTKKVLSRQPVNASATEIAWSNPITRALFDVLTPPYVGHADAKGMLGKISHLNSERGHPLTAGVGAKPIPLGLSYTAYNLNCGVGFVNTGASVFTSYCRMRLNSFTVGDSGFLGESFGLRVGLSANATFFVELYTGSFIKIPIALTAEIGKTYDVVTVTSAANVKLYINGVLLLDQSPNYWNGQGRHGILVTGLVTIGAIDFVAVAGWTRALSFAEVQSISNNPWQLFRSTSTPLVLAGDSSTLAPSMIGGFLPGGGGLLPPGDGGLDNGIDIPPIDIPPEEGL